MSSRIGIALGAALLLALGGAVAEARPMNGGSGGHPGGFSGGASSHAFSGGNAFHGNSFRGNSFRGNSFNSGPRAGRMARGANGFNRRGPVVGYNNYGRGDRHHGHHRGRFIAGVPYYYDYGDYGYGDDCGYYYRRAVSTGSPYWWNRYQACEYEG